MQFLQNIITQPTWVKYDNISKNNNVIPKKEVSQQLVKGTLFNADVTKLNKTNLQEKNIFSVRNMTLASVGILFIGIPLITLIGKGILNPFSQNTTVEPCLNGETDTQSLFKRGQYFVDKDWPKATACYVLAADLGHLESQNNMGHIYQKGLIDENKVLYHSTENSIKYYNMAIGQCQEKTQCDPISIKSYYDLADLYKDKNNFNEAARLYKIAADFGHSDAQYAHAKNCLDNYDKDLDKEASKEETLKYLRLSANQGNKKAQLELADTFKNGYLGLKPSLKEAISYYEKIVSSKDNSDEYEAANYELGKFYEEGKGVTQSFSKAVNYYKEAEGWPIAKHRLAEIYFQGKEGVPQSYEKALQYYLSMEKGRGANADILFRIGSMYENGHGVKQSWDNAYKYYSEAQWRGSNEAYAAIEKHHELLR